MNKITKIAYALIFVFILFLLPVTYANSQLTVDILKDDQKVSSAEAGSIVTVSANIENPTEGEIVTFKCTNSTLSFIDEQTGKEYTEGELVQKELTIDKDGMGRADVSAKVLTDSQIEVDASVEELNPEMDSETADNSNTQTPAAEIDSVSEEEDISEEKETPVESAAPESSTQVQNESDLENTADESNADKDTKTEAATNEASESETNQETADKELSQDEDTTDNSNVESTDQNASDSQTTEKTEIEKFKIQADSVSVKTGDTVNLKATILPETEEELLENVVWTISCSNKEITPSSQTGEEISFVTPEDATGKIITVSAYLPKEIIGAEEDLHAKNITIGALSKNISVGIYPSTDSKTVKPATDIGFSSEILEGEYVADSELSEEAKYTWFAQLGNSYLNGTSFGSTYSVRPLDNGLLKVWVSVTLNNGSIIESEPIQKTITDQESVNLESISIKPVEDSIQSVRAGDEVEFSKELTPADATNIDGAEYNWIAKIGDDVIAESDTDANFKFTPNKEGTLTVSLTITPKDSEPIVSEAYSLEVLEKVEIDEDEPQQMIPENQVGMKGRTEILTDETTSEADGDSKTKDSEKQNNGQTVDNKNQSENNDSGNYEQVLKNGNTDYNSVETDESQSKEDEQTHSEGAPDDTTVVDNPEKPELVVNGDPENPLKLTGAEIKSETDSNNIQIGQKLVLDADIKTEGGGGEVEYSWTATDAEGKTIAASNKLDNFSFTVDKPTDVTTVFEVKVKNSQNTPEEYKTARAEKVFSFKSAEAIAASIDPENGSPQTLVAKDLKPVGSSTSASNSDQNAAGNVSGQNTATKRIENNANKPTSNTNTTKSTNNTIGNNSKENTASSNWRSNIPSLESLRNSNSSKNSKDITSTASSSLDKNNSKDTVEDVDPLKLDDTLFGLNNSEDSKNHAPVSESTLASNDERPNIVESIGSGVGKVLSTPTGIINPRTGDAFNVGEVGTVVLILIAGACAVFGIKRYNDKEFDSNDYYL